VDFNTIDWIFKHIVMFRRSRCCNGQRLVDLTCNDDGHGVFRIRAIVKLETFARIIFAQICILGIFVVLNSRLRVRKIIKCYPCDHLK